LTLSLLLAIFLRFVTARLSPISLPLNVSSISAVYLPGPQQIFFAGGGSPPQLSIASAAVFVFADQMPPVYVSTFNMTVQQLDMCTSNVNSSVRPFFLTIS
jgi:hypothetical protein